MKTLTRNVIRVGVTAAAAAGAILAPKLFENANLDLAVKGLAVGAASTAVDAGEAVVDMIKTTEVTVTKSDDTVIAKVVTHTADDDAATPPKANVTKTNITADEKKS